MTSNIYFDFNGGRDTLWTLFYKVHNLKNEYSRERKDSISLGTISLPFPAMAAVIASTVLFASLVAATFVQNWVLGFAIGFMPGVALGLSLLVISRYVMMKRKKSLAPLQEESVLCKEIKKKEDFATNFLIQKLNKTFIEMYNLDVSSEALKNLVNELCSAELEDYGSRVSKTKNTVLQCGEDKFACFLDSSGNRIGIEKSIRLMSRAKNEIPRFSQASQKKPMKVTLAA